MKRTVVYSIGMSLLFMTLFSCKGPEVWVDKEKYGSFALEDYSTFNFLAGKNTSSETSQYQKNIAYLKKALSRELNRLGLQQNESEAELNINLGVVVEEKTQTRETSLTTDPFMYTGQRHYTWESKEVPVGKYQEGTLTLHLIDASSGKAVWIGTISKALPRSTKNMQKLIDKTVEDLIEEMTSNKN